MAEVTDDFLGSMRALIQSEMIDLNTSLEGVVVSYAGGFASVRPVGSKRFQDGDTLDFPIIHKVPVRWPAFNGGACGIRGPIKTGDKCHLVFSQQASDGSDDMRRHDLSDAYCFMVDNAQVSQGVNDDDMVMFFGTAYIKLTAAGALEINAPAGTKIIAPTNEFTGAVTVKGLFTFLAGMIGSTGAGVAATISGAIAFVGSLTSNGKNISDTHTHTGVTPGGGTTGSVS